MKPIITFFSLLPLLISAMDNIQSPTAHSTVDLVKTRRYIDKIKAIPAIDLLKKIDSLQSEDEFSVALPIIIQELNAEKQSHQKSVLTQERCGMSGECCCAYSKCLAKIGGIFCVSTWVGNAGLHWLLCGTGIMIASCQCESEMRRQNNIRPELQIKLALLEKINSQSSKNGSASFTDYIALAHDASQHAWERMNDDQEDK